MSYTSILYQYITGNGNAAIFQNDPHVHTASMHCAGNYFSAVEVSDSDLEVPVGAGDQEYLDLLDAWLPDVIDAAEPDLIFYQGGVDVCSADRLGKLKLTPAGVIARDDRVYSAAVEASTKLVVTMGGGYPRDLTVGSDAYEELINVHCNVYRRAAVNMQQAEYAAARRRQEYRKDGWKFGKIANRSRNGGGGGGGGSNSNGNSSDGNGNGSNGNGSSNVNAELFIPSLAIELEQSLAERHHARETGKPYKGKGHIKGHGL